MALKVHLVEIGPQMHHRARLESYRQRDFSWDVLETREYGMTYFV